MARRRLSAGEKARLSSNAPASTSFQNAWQVILDAAEDYHKTKQEFDDGTHETMDPKDLSLKRGIFRGTVIGYEERLRFYGYGRRTVLQLEKKALKEILSDSAD